MNALTILQMRSKGATFAQIAATLGDVLRR